MILLCFSISLCIEEPITNREEVKFFLFNIDSYASTLWAEALDEFFNTI